MRHSVDQALKVYDRRSTASKKHKGLELLASHQKQHSPSAVVEKSGPPNVVLFHRVPHQVLREEANMLLLGKMMRSFSSNLRRQMNLGFSCSKLWRCI
jgi:hypothetical protein